MSLRIKRYETADEAALFDLLRSEGGEWCDYLKDEKEIGKFINVLKNCIVYVCYEDAALCGFIRAGDDYGFGIYIYDLLVNKNFRGRAYGKMLIEQLCNDYDGTVYVMSIADEYYAKLGYKIVEERIIKIRE